MIFDCYPPRQVGFRQWEQVAKPHLDYNKCQQQYSKENNFSNNNLHHLLNIVHKYNLFREMRDRRGHRFQKNDNTRYKTSYPRQEPGEKHSVVSDSPAHARSIRDQAQADYIEDKRQNKKD